MTSERQTFVAAKGGLGGLGNSHFKTALDQAPKLSSDGTPGEEKVVELELKTIADIGLVSKFWKGIVITKALFLWRKVALGKRITLQAKSTLASIYNYENGVNPFACAKSWQECLHMLWFSCLDQVDLPGWAKVFTWRIFGPTRRMTILSKKGNPAKQVTLLAKPTFCSLC